MPVFHRPRTGDVVTVPEALKKKYDADPEWESGAPKAAKPAAEQKEKDR